MKLYVISNLTMNIRNKKSNREGRSTVTFTFTFVLFMALVVTNFSTIKAFLPFNSLLLFIIMAFIGVLLSAQITVLFSTNLREKARVQANNDNKNKTFSIEKVWGIPTGGIIPIDTKIGTTLSVTYTTECILLKSVLNASVERDEETVQSHYASMGKFIDIISNNNFTVEVVTLKYNIENDSIWQEEIDIVLKSDLGEKYKTVLSALNNNLYDTTKQKSTVTATYYIIKRQHNSLCTASQLLSHLISLSATSRAVFGTVDLNEFKSLLENYFGVNIHLEDLNSYVTEGLVPLGQTKLISYSQDDVNYVTVSNIYKYELPQLRNLDGGIFELSNDIETVSKDVEDYEDTEDNIFTSELL